MFGLRTDHYWKCLPIVLSCVWGNLASGEAIQRPILTRILCCVGADGPPDHSNLPKAVDCYQEVNVGIKRSPLRIQCFSMSLS